MAELSPLCQSAKDYNSLPAFRAANETATPIFGSKTLTLNLNLKGWFSWLFLIADAPNNMLEANFLTEFNLAVDRT